MAIKTKKLIFPRARPVAGFSMYGVYFFIDIMQLVMAEHEQINMLETGVLAGNSSKLFIAAIKETAKPFRYYAVDPHDEQSTGIVPHDEASNKFQENAPEAIYFRKYSHDFWREDKEKIEPLCLAVLDGAHDAAGEAEDFLEAYKIKGRGSFAGIIDDTEVTGQGVLVHIAEHPATFYELIYPTISKRQILGVYDVPHKEIVRLTKFHGGKVADD